jgi:23S rRNA (adenine-N6)-dimethyltransferase
VAAKRRSQRDRRRRTHGQNFLVDPGVVDRLIGRLDLRPDDLVVDIGAGSGALTIPLAQAGARVLAIERDGAWVTELQRGIERPVSRPECRSGVQTSAR